MRTKKVLLFTTDFPPSIGGGIGTHAHFMVDSLRMLGWSFVVCSEYYISCTNKSIDEYSRQKDIPIYKLPSSPSVIKLIKKVAFCVKIGLSHKPDIVVGTGRHTTWFAALVSVFISRPLITIGHGTEFSQKTSSFDLFLNRISYSKSNVLIAISEFTKEVIMNSKIKPKYIQVMNNPANETLFRKLGDEEVDNFRRERGIKDKKIILTSGALSKRKGQHIVIESLPHVLEKFPDVLYVAVGLPLKKIELEILSKKLGVSGHVLLPGIVEEDELLLWLNSCEVFAMTSVHDDGDYEGFGIAVIEAALCGKTAIVSDNGGLKEAVRNGETGIVVPEGDALAVANAIITLFENENKMRELERNAYEYACNNSTYGIKAIEYDKVFSSILL